MEVQGRKRREWEAGRRARAAEEVLKRRNQLAAEERAAKWTGVVHLLGSMDILAKVLLQERLYRPLRAKRKEAALIIAAEYKSLLDRRRQKNLDALVKRLKKVIAPAIPRLREKYKNVCSHRALGFLKVIADLQQNQASVAVTRFMQSVHRLQNWWKTMLLVRQTQHTLLTNHFLKFEKHILRANKLQMKAQLQKPTSLAAALSVKKANPVSLSGMASGKSLFTAVASLADVSHSGVGGGGGKGGGGMLASHVMDVGDDPALDRLLSMHLEPLTDEHRDRIINHVLIMERKVFAKRMDKYRMDVSTYSAQKHVEELRLKLMKEAGLDATPRLRKPVKPIMLALLPKGRLKLLLAEGVQEVLKIKQEHEEEEIEAAAMFALEASRVRRGVSTASRPASSKSVRGQARKEIEEEEENEAVAMLEATKAKRGASRLAISKA